MDTNITHAHCPDGLFASFVVAEKYPGIKTVFCTYSSEPPWDDIDGKDVIITDFSFKRDVLEEINARAKSLVVIDHHKTAQEDLDGLDFCKFDMDHSGAVLTWMHLFPGYSVPKILQYIEDRDLWKFVLPHSKEMSCFVNNTDNSELERSYWRPIMDSYQALWAQVDIEGDEGSKMSSSTPAEKRIISSMINDGSAYKKMIDIQVERTCYSSRRVEILGIEGMCVNASGFHSEIGDYLCKKNRSAAFAAMWCHSKDGSVKVSLRSDSSNPNAADVSEIAKVFGGGGHKHASGFVIKPDDNISNRPMHFVTDLLKL